MDPRLAPRGEGLLPSEFAGIAQAVEKRQRQYTAGRLLARELLAQRGFSDYALVSDAQRVPQWPTGTIGCITHTDSWCAVSVANSSLFQGLGIDVEPDSPLARDLWESIARPEELEWLARQPETERGRLCKGLFSAKESIYKSLYPSVRIFLGFDAMLIEFQRLDEHRFEWTATLQRDWGDLPRGRVFSGGQLLFSQAHLATAIALPSPAASE